MTYNNYKAKESADIKHCAFRLCAARLSHVPALFVSLQDRPAMQLYQPGARNRKRMSSAGKGYDCIPVGHSPEPRADHCYDVVTMATGLEKGFEKSKDEQ